MFKDFILEEINKGKSYQDIASIMGISYQSVQCYVTRGNYPTVSNLMKLAEHYNLSIDYILGYTKEKRPLFPEQKKKNK